MKKSRFDEEQIIGILKQQESGQKVVDLAREHGSQRSNDLHLEEQVQRLGCQRGATEGVPNLVEG